MNQVTGQRGETARPNILFIVTDQQATETLSCYGGLPAVTPGLDGLATDGVRFDRAYTPCPLCTPARASLLTGLYPHRHGAMHNTATHHPFDESMLGRGQRFYSHALAEAGYRVGYAGKFHAGLARTCGDAGFEGFGPADYGVCREEPAYGDYLEREGLDPPVYRPFWNAHDSDPDWGTGNTAGRLEGSKRAAPCFFLADYAQRWISDASRGGQPWSMSLNFWGPHAPYAPTQEFLDLIPETPRLDAASAEDGLASRPGVQRRWRDSVFPHAVETDRNVWRRVRRSYFAFASMIDDAIRGLLDWLKARSLYEHTLVIFCADHGETCGTHGGCFDKGPVAFEEVYRVPLIVKPPVGGSGQTGGSCGRLVSLLDVPATILDAAGATPLDGQGTSLLPLTDDPTGPGRDALLCQFHGHRLPVAQRVLVTQTHKYVLNFAETDELYDLDRDPHEMMNLIDEPGVADTAVSLRRRMVEAMDTVGDTLGPQSRHFVLGGVVHARDPVNPTESSDTR
ncbi:MAG: sulfatase-like hydrolase/transferase [Planctomycetota bacterium]